MEINHYDGKVIDALDVIVGKWKAIILITLLFGGTKRFGEIRKRIPQITPKMLTQHLRDLEEEGIVKRTVFPEVPPRVEYSLTEYGKTLEPVLKGLYDWAMNHVSKKV